MAISERLCWEILDLVNGGSVPKGWVKDGSRDGEPIPQTMALVDLEYDLILRHRKGEIEDCLYFLEKRRYLFLRGYKGMTRVTYGLTNRGKLAVKRRTFDADEESAFAASIVDVSTVGPWGLKFNLRESFRRSRRSARRDALPSEFAKR